MMLRLRLLTPRQCFRRMTLPDLVRYERNLLATPERNLLATSDLIRYAWNLLAMSNLIWIARNLLEPSDLIRRCMNLLRARRTFPRQERQRSRRSREETLKVVFFTPLTSYNMCWTTSSTALIFRACATM